MPMQRIGEKKIPLTSKNFGSLERMRKLVIKHGALKSKKT
jgi:hypothetical protein